MNEFATTLPVLWKWLLGLCGMIVALGGAAAVISKLFAPIRAIEGRLDALEKRHNADQEENEIRLKNDLEVLHQQEETLQKLCQCVLAQMDNAITGNSIDRLKRAREEMNTHLIERSMRHEHHH